MFWDKKLIEELRKNGIDYNNGKLTKLPTYSGNDPHIDAKLEYHNVSLERKQDWVHGQMKLQWVESLEDTIDLLCQDNGDWTVAKAFWIHLDETIDEFLSSEEKSLENLKNLLPSPTFWKLAEDYAKSLNDKSVVGLLIREVEAAKALKSLFAKEELVFIDYRRQTDCHIIQESYDVQLKKNNQIKYERNMPILGPGVSLPIKDIDKMVHDLLRKYNPNLFLHIDETRIAIDFAKRIRATALDTKLVEIMRKLHTPITK